MEYELKPIHDSRNSFYKKAYVIEDDGIIKLRSYQTIVCVIENNKPIVYGTYSHTTLRHIKEFLIQKGFSAISSKQILEDYSPTEEDNKKEQEEQTRKFKGLTDSLKMICAVGDVMTDNKKEKNDFKLRMIKAGLENRGLIIPEDWEDLKEDEKERRINGMLEII